VEVEAFLDSISAPLSHYLSLVAMQPAECTDEDVPPCSLRSPRAFASWRSNE
jgi:hypothetical protein